MTPRKCVLHIGTHKTGTTSVQVTLSNRRHELARRGYLYPSTGIPAGLAGHHNLAWQLAGDPRFTVEAGTLDDLLREIGHQAGNVVLSSEDFEGVATRQPIFSAFVQTLKQAGLEVSIVVYLREQAGYAVSLYLELLKHGLSTPFDDFLQDVIQHKVVQWKSWAFSFCYRTLLETLPGDVHVTVRSYDSVESTVADFLSLLELAPADVEMAPESRLNQSIRASAAFLEFYRNRANRRTDEVSPVLQAAVEKAFGSGDLVVSAVNWAALSATFSDSNRFVESRYNIGGLGLDMRRRFSPGSSCEGHLQPEQVFSVPVVRLADALVDT